MPGAYVLWLLSLFGNRLLDVLPPRGGRCPAGYHRERRYECLSSEAEPAVCHRDAARGRESVCGLECGGIDIGWTYGSPGAAQ